MNWRATGDSAAAPGSQASGDRSAMIVGTRKPSRTPMATVAAGRESASSTRPDVDASLPPSAEANARAAQCKTVLPKAGAGDRVSCQRWIRRLGAVRMQTRWRRTVGSRDGPAQRVRVTLLRLRGASGSRPRARVRCIAWSCPIDDRHDRAEPLGRARRQTRTASAPAPGRPARPTRPRARRRGPRAGARAARSARRAVGPGRTVARTGTPGSRSASGPCSKSAAEYGSAKTRASSLSLSAHSRAVAYS